MESLSIEHRALNIEHWGSVVPSGLDTSLRAISALKRRVIFGRPFGTWNGAAGKF